MATAVETPVESLPNEPEANKLFRMVMKYKGSDLHLKVGMPPAMRLAEADAAFGAGDWAAATDEHATNTEYIARIMTGRCGGEASVRTIVFIAVTLWRCVCRSNAAETINSGPHATGTAPSI